MEIQYKTGWLADLTSMARIQSALHQKHVQAIVDVQDVDLGYVSDLCLTDDPQNYDLLTNLIMSGAIVVYTDPNIITIPSTNCVDCILAEPYYLVKDLKKRFE